VNNNNKITTFFTLGIWDAKKIFLEMKKLLKKVLKLTATTARATTATAKSK
jgi:hypothetical protein